MIYVENNVEKYLTRDIKYIETDIITRIPKKKNIKGKKRYDYIKFCKPLNAVAAINMTKQQYIKYWKTKYKDYPQALLQILKVIKNKFETGLTPIDKMIELIQQSNDIEKEKQSAIKSLIKKKKKDKKKILKNKWRKTNGRKMFYSKKRKSNI